MALSKLRQEAQKERKREEARKKQNAQQNTQRQTSQSAAGSSGVSKLRQEAAKERAQNPDVYKWKAPAQDFKPNFVIPQASRNNAETSKTTRTATGGGAQSGGPDAEYRAAAGMGTRTSSIVQGEIDTLKTYRDKLMQERSRMMENTDAPADGGKLRDLTEQIRTISDRMNALDNEKNRLSDIERKALLDSGEIEDSDWWDIVVKSLNFGVKSLNSGVAQFNNAFASTADFLLPTDFLGEYDPASRFSDWTQKKYEQAEQERQETLIGRGKASQIISDLGTAAVAALPQSILAMFSGGASAAAQGGAALTAGAVSPGVAEMANNAIRSMAKNPQYWMSFIQTLGTDYDEAKSNGASNAEAAVTAVLSSAVNAAIEIGGGIETLPENLKSGDTSRILSWVRSMGEEGMEEVQQRIVSGATQKAVYDQDKPVYSTTDENAIVNPSGMARDFLMGAGVAGILGGGQVVGVKAMNAYYDAKAKTAQAVQDAKVKAAEAAVQAQERKVQEQRAAWEKANAHFEVPEDVADVPYTQVERNGAPVDNFADAVDNDIMEAAHAAAQAEQESKKAPEVREETENTPAVERTAMEADETRPIEEVIPSEEKPATTARSAERNDMLPVPAREHDTRGAAVNMLARTAQEAKMGENGVRAIGEWYDETENPQIAPYFGAFTAFYNGGRNGLDYDAIHSGQASAVTEVVRRAAYNAGRMDAIEAAAKSAPEPVANPAQRGYTDGVKTGESAKTPKYKTIRTKKSDWAATDITWYAPHQKSPIAYSTAAVRDFIGAMVDDNPTATVRELQAKIKYDQDAKKVLQQYIDAGYGDDVVSDCFGDDTVTEEPAKAAAETQQKPKSAAKTQQDGESKPAEHVPLNTDKELDAVLNLGTGTAGGERRVREFYNNNPGVSVKEATDFLKKEFGIGSRSHKLTDGTSGFADWDAKGIRLWVTPDGDEHTFTWAQVDARYRAIYGVESTKEDNNNGERALGEVPDEGAIRSAGAGRQDAGGLLDTVASEDVREDAQRGDAGTDVTGLRREAGRLARGASESGTEGVRGSGVHQGGSVLSTPGEVTTVEASLEETPAPASTEIAEKAELGNQEQPKGTNLVISEKGMKMPSTPKARYKANVDAVKTLRTIMAEGRMATPEEQAVLAKYTGWGGLSDVFDERKTDWEKEYKQLRKLLDDGEYKTAKGSVLDAYYTDPAIIRGMYNGLAGLGFTGGRMLEPGAGVGRFIGAMPQEMLSGVRSWTAVELDKITGNIAKYLYPNADVRVQGFETAKIPDGYMDVVIGNVPFGNIPIADKAYPASVTKSIHNYFIAKSLDKVRTGGILTVITSRETMDAMSDAVRAYFMKQADLIGAIRLPNTAFQGTGTNVVSDILVFKKREPGTAYKGEAFLESEYRYVNGSDVYAATNEYFENHPEMVLGTPKNTGGRYGQTLTYDPLETRLSLQKQIEKAFGSIQAKMEYPVQRTQEEIRKEIKEAASKGKDGSIFKKDGKLYKNENGVVREATSIKAVDQERMSGIVEIRDAARTLLDLQLDDGGEKAIAIARKNLNTLYDAFVKKNGILNSHKNKKLIREDVDSPFILALEDYNKDTGTARKAAIFTKNTVKANVTVTHTDTVEEAMTVSMNEIGRVDTRRIAQLTGQSEQAVERDMLDRGLAYRNRNGDLETAEQYLSGNVRAKLRDAEALADGDADYKRNVEALRKVIPEDIPAEEIKVRLGATWVPDSVYSAFASEMLNAGMTWRNGQRVHGVQITYNKPVGKFFIEINDAWLRSRPENTSTWGTEDVNFAGGRQSILDAALNNKTVAVWRTSGETRVLDRQATAAAQEKLEKVLAEFQGWIWKDETRRTELGGMYNEVFNNTVTPKYDGSYLTVNGSNPEMEMRPHQKNAVQRIINSGGNTLLAHRVGAGKTYEMAAAAMKLRQLGIVKKPLFAVPKHLVAQWGKEFLSYFPAAKILVLGEHDFTPAKRKLFANRIATGDYDAVIMSYEQLGMVPMSQANQEAFYQEQIDALEMAILESKRQSGKRDPSIRDMERSKKAFETKLKKLGDSKKDEGNIDFEQLGVDALFVDEAHNFKNLFYTTKMQGVADLGDKEGSQRAFDLYMKVRYLQKLNGGRGIVFATATPVMNSVVELYTMQRYLQGDLLDAKGLTNFDAWANQFADVVTIRKMKTGGNGYELKQSLSRYKNLGEMQQMFRSFADVITDPADLPYLKIPKMKGGKRIVVECEPSAFQEKFMEDLGKRAEALRGAGKGGSEDHIFKVFDDGKKISYTQRMIDSSLPYEDGGKIMKCVGNIYDVWQRTEDNKGTQLVFCDRGTPGGAEALRGVSLYEDMRDLLVGAGIPKDEIAFIHEADTDDLKQKLFKDVNDGRVRVLIGSTAKMGTGMNAQKRIAALHELNAPDRPGDLEQNEGRGLRQGNMYEEVEVYAYVTKKTFDSRQWDNLKRKAAFIHQIMAGEYNGREADGDGDLALSAAEISAIASDNPLIMEQFEISEKIANLENLARAHTKEVADAKYRIAQAEREIGNDTEYLERYKADLEARQETAGDKFKLTIGNKTYKDRKAAGEALIAAAKKHIDIKAETETNTEIGSFAGFALLVTSKGDVLLRGKAQYRGNINLQSAVGTIQSLEAIPKRLENIIAAKEKALSENRAAIVKLQAVAASSFARQDELVAARVREAEIYAELNPPKEQQMAAAEAEAGDVEYMKETGLANDKKDHPEHWTTTRAGDPNKTPMRLSDIIEKIRHDFGLNITTGHIRGSDTRGQYNRRDHGIRSRIANDLPTIAHELGHHFDEMFGLQDGITEDMRQELLDKLDPDLAKRYSKKKLLGEGIAEYVRKFLQNREVAAIDYPQFHDYFMKQFTGKDLALIEQLADEINAYYSMDADTATSSIRLREEGAPDARTFGEKIRDKMSVLYQAWVDSNEGIKRFDRATGSNTYIMASNAAYSDAMAGAIITGDLTDANGNYVAPGLKTALHGLNMQDEAEYRLFGEYLVVKHGPERLNEGMRIFADDRKNSTQWMNARQAELEAQYPQFAEISDRLYQFQKDFLATWGVATGLVSQESADEWADRWAYYVPFNRAVSEDKRGGGAKRGFANQNSTIKKARGSGLEIIHPVDNIINNIVRMVNAGVRNNVMRAITDAAQTMGADAAFLEQVPAPLTRTAFSMAGVKQDLTAMLEESSLTDIDKAHAQNIVGTLDNILYQYGRGKAHGDTITVLKGGKPEFWKINDSQLLDSLTSMSQPKMHGILDAYGRISRFMTSNITGSNVIWSIFSNLPRDLGTFFTYSKNKNIAKMAAGIGSAYLNKAKGDNASPLYKEYLAMGGGNESMYSADRDLAKKARKKLEGKKINLNPLDWITFVSDMVESGPRFATYKLLREAGMNPQEAFYEAMDITVNFRRGGTWARQVNKVAPFFNANVQGLDKFFRWISGEEASRLGKDRTKLVRTRAMQYLVASIVLAAIQALHIMAGDDEDKEKAYTQLSSFTKNSYWNFFMGDGKFFAVPKPREIAVLSSFFERCIELYIADNEHAFDEFYVYATDNFFPAFASDLLQLPVNGPKETMGSVIGNFGLLGAFGYISANRDFLGRPIVSSGLQNLEPKDQYTERTSKLAYWMGQAFDESPAMIDYFFEQTLGGWWKYQKAIFPVGEDARDLSLGIRNSYIKDSQYSTDLVNWMYDQASASQAAKNSDPSNMEKAITARMDNNMTAFYSRYYSQAKKVRETDRSRNVRQTVLDMIREYQKASDHGELTAAQEAVYAVCEKAGSTEYLPSVMQVSIKDGSDRAHELSAIQYVEYQTDYNRLYWEYVEDKLPTATTQAQKVAVLKAAKDVAREEATNRTLARIGAPKTDFAEKYAGLDAEDVVTFKAQLDLADDDDGSVQQAEFVDIILNMGLDDDEIYTLYFSKYDSETAYEAREVGIPADVYFPAKTEMANIKADKDQSGKSISGSRRKKIEAYLNTVAQDYKQYLWLLGTEYESIFKDPDYIRFFGRK